MGSTAIWCLPAIAILTYIFAFPHYKFRSQLFFFFAIVAFIVMLVLVETTQGTVFACIGLGLISVINIFRFTAPQL